MASSIGSPVHHISWGIFPKVPAGASPLSNIETFVGPTDLLLGTVLVVESPLWRIIMFPFDRLEHQKHQPGASFAIDIRILFFLSQLNPLFI
jgi:hypothetical protein